MERPSVRDALVSRGAFGDADSIAARVAAGALTGAVGSAVFNPIDVVRIRMQGPTPYPSTLGAFGAFFFSRRSPYDRVRVVNFIPQGLSLPVDIPLRAPPLGFNALIIRAAVPDDSLSRQSSSLSAHPTVGFNPRPRRLSTPTDAFELHPDVCLSLPQSRSRSARASFEASGAARTRASRERRC
jgi:hypothetical protein